MIWGFIEPTLTIVAASIPMMRHLFKSFHRDDDEYARSSGNPNGPDGLPRSNATNTTTGANSVGGGREGRLAAARANERAAAAAAEMAEKEATSDGSAPGTAHERGRRAW